MPIFEYNGPTPNSQPTYTIDANGNMVQNGEVAVSDPIPYTMEGVGAPTVEDRTFQVGEHVAAATNPDPAVFTEVGQTISAIEAEALAAAAEVVPDEAATAAPEVPSSPPEGE